MEEERLFGIKQNGVLIKLDKISFNDDQSVYDYICNVSFGGDYNGNGNYVISILDKDFQGMSVGKWKITKALIHYDWNYLWALMKLEDEDGNETNYVTAEFLRGSKDSIDIPLFIRKIITRAQEIVRDYPNAKICDALEELNESRKKLGMSDLINGYKRVVDRTDKEYINFIEMASEKISKHLRIYKATKKILEGSDDPRSKKLLNKITSECRHLLESFRISE